MKILSRFKQNALFKNMGYLTILQMANYLFPLITVPYMNWTIKVSGYGVLVLAQSVVSYFILIVNYGFYYSGPRMIAINRDDPEKISEIFSAIMLIKSLLMILSFGCVALLAWLVPVFRGNYPAYIVSLLAIVGEVIFPVWFFQGMESMSYITKLNLASRFITTVLLVVLVHGPGDLYTACTLQALAGAPLAGVFAIFVIFRKFKVRLVLPSRELLYEYMHDNWNLFLAQFSTSVFTNINPLLLGLMVSRDAVGIYGVADKAVRMVVSLIQPVTTAVYPRVTRLFAQSFDEARLFVKKVLKFGTAFFFFISLCLFVAAPLITLLITGKNLQDTTTIIRILCLIPTSIFINNMYGTQIMINCGLQVQFRNIILFCGFFLILSSAVLIHMYSAIGAGVGSLLAELLMTGLMVFAVERNKRLRLFRTSFNTN